MPSPSSPRNAPSALSLPGPIEWTRRIAVGGVLALIVLGLAWELWLAPLPGGTGALAIKVLPLAVPLAGLMKLKLYTYRWTALLVWLYVTEAAVRMSSDRGLGAWLAVLELLLSLTLFVACAAHVRLRLAHGRLLSQPPVADAGSSAQT